MSTSLRFGDVGLFIFHALPSFFGLPKNNKDILVTICLLATVDSRVSYNNNN